MTTSIKRANKLHNFIGHYVSVMDEDFEHAGVLAEVHPVYEHTMHRWDEDEYDYVYTHYPTTYTLIFEDGVTAIIDDIPVLVLDELYIPEAP